MIPCRISCSSGIWKKNKYFCRKLLPLRITGTAVGKRLIKWASSKAWKVVNVIFSIFMYVTHRYFLKVLQKKAHFDAHIYVGNILVVISRFTRYHIWYTKPVVKCTQILHIYHGIPWSSTIFYCCWDDNIWSQIYWACVFTDLRITIANYCRNIRWNPTKKNKKNDEC